MCVGTPCSWWPAAARSGPTIPFPRGETEVECVGGEGLKGLRLLLPGSRGCGGDTKGLAGVTKGMVVCRSRITRTMIQIGIPTVTVNHVVTTLVTSARTGTLVHGVERGRQVLLLDLIETMH